MVAAAKRLAPELYHIDRRMDEEQQDRLIQSLTTNDRFECKDPFDEQVNFS